MNDWENSYKSVKESKTFYTEKKPLPFPNVANCPSGINSPSGPYPPDKNPPQFIKAEHGIVCPEVKPAIGFSHESRDTW